MRALSLDFRYLGLTRSGRHEDTEKLSDWVKYPEFSPPWTSLSEWGPLRQRLICPQSPLPLRLKSHHQSVLWIP